MKSGVQIVSGAAQVAGGVTTVVDSKDQYDGEMARAGVQRKKAELMKMAALDEEDQRKIRQLIEMLENSTHALLATLSSTREVERQIHTSV